jgi:hypothetical protein
MARINIVNADNKIDATPQRAYFKLKQTGGPKGEKGDTGAQGPIGPQGPQGASASVSVNSTTTLPAGSSATVENIGTAQNVKLNFGIPTGPQGPQGEQGPQGAQGPQGPKGDNGAKGDDGAAATVDVNATNTGAPGTNALVENVGTNTAALLNFTIPRGEKGETGTNATIEIGATTTLPAGDNATVQNVGSETAAVLNFGIPQGEKGDKGDDGASFSTQVVQTLPETGEENVFYLTPKAHTTETATGNPITATVTEDAGALKSSQLDGDTFQQSYTGKNLVKPVTTSSITSSYDAATGEYSVSRNTAASWPWLTGYCTLSHTITSGTTMTISRNIGSSFNFWVRTYHSDDTYGSYNFGTDILSQTTTEEKDIDRIVVMANAVPDNFSYSFKLQLELGNEATSFEPYVGGTPSPNPDYPQPVQTVTGEQTIEIVGKNLCSSDWESGDYNTTTGAKGTGSGYRTADFIRVEPDTTYIVSRASVGVGMNVLRYDKDKNYLASSTVSAGNSFTTASNVAYITMYRGTTGGIAEMMLEKGSTVTSYAPYSATSYHINLGKNLFNKGNYTDADGYYIGGSGRYTAASNNHTAIIPIEPNTTYTVSKTAQATYNRFRVGISDTLASAGDYFPIWGGSDSATEVTLTSGSKSRYMYIYYAVTINVSDAIASLMLEKGATATTYAPYFTPIELCKLGDYQDYIYKDGDSWKVHKATAAYALNGTESWSETSTGVPYTTAITNYALSGNTPVSEYFIGATNRAQAATLPDNSIGFNDTNSAVRLWVKYLDKWSTGASVATWLAQNPATIYYALKSASQTDTAITDSTLIAQLEAIRTAVLESGTNTITNSAAGSNLAGDMEITYYGYDPTNRYDKFIWLDLNNNYEQIGS